MDDSIVGCSSVGCDNWLRYDGDNNIFYKGKIIIILTNTCMYFSGSGHSGFRL